MRFQFKKLYADLVTMDGNVCVVYIAQVDVGGIYRNRYGAIELYQPNGQRVVIRASKPPDFPEFNHSRSDMQVALETPGGRFILDHKARHGGGGSDRLRIRGWLV